MGKQAWRYDSLERNTKLIREFCKKYKFQLEELTPYQFRVEGVVDLYPVRQRWHWVGTDKRGHFSGEEDLKMLILENLPETEEDNPKEEKKPKKISEIIVIEGKDYQVESYSPLFSDGSRQATLKEIK